MGFNRQEEHKSSLSQHQMVLALVLFTAIFHNCYQNLVFIYTKWMVHNLVCEISDEDSPFQPSRHSSIQSQASEATESAATIEKEIEGKKISVL